VSVSPYILDLQTGEKISLPYLEKSGVSFLTDNLLYVSLSYDENYVLDRITGNQYPLRKFHTLRPGAYIEGHADPILLADALRQAKYVFFRNVDDTIVALDTNFPTSSENNFIINRFGIPGENPNRTEQFLRANHIVYQTIPSAYFEEVTSPDGRFIARTDGIYLADTGQKLVEGYSLSVRGWTYDGHGVIYSHALGRCLLRIGFPFADDTGCLGRVAQPVIKLKVPEEYLLPNETQ